MNDFYNEWLLTYQKEEDALVILQEGDQVENTRCKSNRDRIAIEDIVNKEMNIDKKSCSYQKLP